MNHMIEFLWHLNLFDLSESAYFSVVAGRKVFENTSVGKMSFALATILRAAFFNLLSWNCRTIANKRTKNISTLLCVS